MPTCSKWCLFSPTCSTCPAHYATVLCCLHWQSCENLASDVEYGGMATEEKKPDSLLPEQIDGVLLLLEQGVDFALQHAKLWSKYAKDVMMYVEKRAHIEMEYTKSLSKLAMTVRPLISEEVRTFCKSIKPRCQIC